MRLWKMTWAVGMFTTAILVSAKEHPEIAPPPPFEPVSWLPATEAALQKASTLAQDLTLSPRGARRQKEDTITVLAQLTNDAGQIRQWAVALKVNGIKPEEEKLRTSPFTLYFNTGPKVEFAAEPLEGIAIHVLGPFTSDRGAARAKDVWSGTLVPPSFLELGLDQAAAAIVRLDHFLTSDPTYAGKSISFSANTAPFPPEIVAAQGDWFERYAPSAAELRSYAGIVPALNTFYMVASRTPGLKDVLLEVVDIPWLSLVGSGGKVRPDFDLTGEVTPLAPADWGLPQDEKVWGMGLLLRINGKPALRCRLAVTTPRPPLVGCAGIVGLAAVRPDGKGSHFMLRVMAGQPGQPKS